MIVFIHRLLKKTVFAHVEEERNVQIVHVTNELLHVGEQLGVWDVPETNGSLLLSISYVCPEPVLVGKQIAFIYQWLQKVGFRVLRLRLDWCVGAIRREGVGVARVQPPIHVERGDV